MAGTNRYMNWTGAKFTPTGGGAVTINGVESVKLGRDAQPEYFKADLAVYVQAIAVPSMRRAITVTSADVVGLAGIAQGADGAFEVTLADAKNGITNNNGAVKISLTNCVVADNTADGSHGKFAKATITFEGYASNGSTDPMVITAL